MVQTPWWRTPRMWRCVGVGLVGAALLAAAVWGRVEPNPPVPPPLTTVWIAAGSEDYQFFADPAVQDEFHRHGYQVNVVPVGSLDMAAPQFCLTGYDLLFPSSSVIADQLAGQPGTGIRGEINAFTTPLVALTWMPLLGPLIEAGLASRNADGTTYTFHLGAYIQETQKHLLWSDIALPSVFSQKSLVQAQFSDPRRSNSGAMVIAAASYVLNNGVVANPAAISRVAAPLGGALASMGSGLLTWSEI
jgi:hypothetical protein